MQKALWILTLVFFNTAITGRAQTPPTDTPLWQRFVHAEGRFQALFPGIPQAEVLTEKDYPDTHYFSVQSGWATYHVSYSDVGAEPLTREEIATVMAELPRKLFTGKNDKLLAQKKMDWGGYSGCELKWLSDDEQLRVRTFVVGARLYQIGVVTPAGLWLARPQHPSLPAQSPEQLKVLQAYLETLATDFMNSLKLPQSTPGPAAQEKTADDAASPDARPAPKFIPVKGGVLQGALVQRAMPSYPALAKAARISGQVTIQVTINEAGQVIETDVISSPPLLWEAALVAMRQSVFKPTELNGIPVKVQGRMAYKFTLP